MKIEKETGNYPRVILRKGREESLLRFHPWVFSGAIHSATPRPGSGDIVEVYSFSGIYLGTGHYENSSLSVKIISFKREPVDAGFWNRKIENAYRLRTSLGLTNNPETNAYRLVFTEGDGLPGLIIDFYNGLAVFQAQTQGMFNARQEITQALKNVYGAQLKAIYDKSPDSFFEPNSDSQQAGRFLYGQSASPVEILEHGNKFLVDFVKGQKTGFFLDQRENRKLSGQYAAGRKVLNLFSYSGGFSVYALQAGAREVIRLIVPLQPLNLPSPTSNSTALMKPNTAALLPMQKTLFRKCPDDFDLVILDPPAFAKHRESRHRAMQGYKFLNTAVLKKIKPGGILFTFSCSQVVGTDLFESIVMASAIEASRNVRILHRLSQPPDHPVSIFHPEGVYLKGLGVYVE